MRSSRLAIGVVIGDRTEARPGKHDQGGWSQARYQRHIEHLVYDHLRHVADARAGDHGGRPQSGASRERRGRRR